MGEVVAFPTRAPPDPVSELEAALGAETLAYYAEQVSSGRLTYQLACEILAVRLRDHEIGAGDG